MNIHGRLDWVGFEATGWWGAGLNRHLTMAEIEVIEVNRLDRNPRRLDGNHVRGQILSVEATTGRFVDLHASTEHRLVLRTLGPAQTVSLMAAVA